MGLILLAVLCLSRLLQGPLIPLEAEAAAPLLGEEAGGGGLGGMMKGFNDSPVTKIAGSIGGKLVHAAMGAIGTHGPEERVNEGPMGHLA